MDSVYLKKADWLDADLLFEWRNDHEVRLNSFNVEKIGYDEHIEWYKNCLEEASCELYLCIDKTEIIGQIRLNYQKYSAKISYSIDYKKRGKGYGNQIIRLIELEVKEEHPEIVLLIGEVKIENIASQRIFERNDYKKRNTVENCDRLTYYKEL